MRERRELVSARQQLQSKRVALLNTIQGYVYQAEHRLPAMFFTEPTWRAQLARLPVSVPLRLIIQTFMTSIEVLMTAEQQLTVRLQAIADLRCDWVETIPALGAVSARVIISAVDEARRFEDQEAVLTMPLRRRFIRGGRSSTSGGSIAMGGGGPDGVAAVCPDSGAHEKSGSETSPAVLCSGHAATGEEAGGRRVWRGNY